MRMELNKPKLKRLHPVSKPTDIYDTILPGLMVRLNPSGRDSYFLRCRVRGEDTRIKVAAFHTLSIDAARNEARKILQRIASGEDVRETRRAGKKVTLEQWLTNEFTPHVTSDRPKHGLADVNAIRAAFADFLPKPLTYITRRRLDKWRAERLASGTAPTTCNRLIARLRAALNVAVRWGDLESNPLAGYRMDKENNERVRYLSAEEERRLLDALSEREEEARARRDRYNAWCAERGLPGYPDLRAVPFVDYVTPLIVTLKVCGLRRGEALALEWRDVDFERKTLTLRGETTKNGRTRHVPLFREALEVLRTWRTQCEGEGHVFASAGTGRQVQHVNGVWARLRDAAQLTDLRLHDLRHHAAAVMATRGVPLNSLREILGHRSYTMVLRYAHLMPEAHDEAHRIMDSAPANVISFDAAREAKEHAE